MLETNEIHQLVYFSRSQNFMSEDEVRKIVDRAARHNKENNITGMLIYRDGFFLQILEGEMFNVAATFKKIRDDKRHSSVTLIHSASASERLFPNWSMALVDTSPFDPDLIEQTVGLFNIKKMHQTTKIVELFHRFRFHVA